MKWFRHFSNASMSGDLVALEAQFGLVGYARWWKLLEIVAMQMDDTDRYSVTLPWSKWESYLSGKRKLLLSYLLATEKLGLTQVIANGELVEIKIPKLALYRDEYSRKSGQTPKKLRTVDTETDTETEHTPSKTEAGASPEPDTANPRHRETNPRATGTNPRNFAPLADGFNAFWTAYPTKEGKAKAKESWAKIRPDEAITTQILDGIERAKRQSRKWQEGFIPLPATWLNQRRWEDEFGPAQSPNNSMPALASSVPNATPRHLKAPVSPEQMLLRDQVADRWLAEGRYKIRPLAFQAAGQLTLEELRIENERTG